MPKKDEMGRQVRKIEKKITLVGEKDEKGK